MHDVLIIGGGPAGLSGALVLGRCGRKTLLCDDGRARNLRTPKINGYLGANNLAPLAFRQLGREQLVPYPLVGILDERIDEIACIPEGFAARTAAGTHLRAKKLLFATGVQDETPEWPGVAEHYGRGVYTCPYCDAWENRQKSLAVYGRGTKGYGFALEMTIWTDKVTLVSDGPAGISLVGRTALDKHGISLREERVSRIIGDGHQLHRVEFCAGPELPCAALFLATGQSRSSRLPEQLGCQLDEVGRISCDNHCSTSHPGVYVAGDVETYVGTQMAIAAAADGARAAQAINQQLLRDSLGDIMDLAVGES